MEERARIHAAIGTVARGIEHYGSTAVAEYLRMKEQAAILAPEGRANYNELKHAFIEGVKDRLARVK